MAFRKDLCALKGSRISLAYLPLIRLWDFLNLRLGKCICEHSIIVGFFDSTQFPVLSLQKMVL
jgi:hypothetical protein